jgi:hypothetical protein
MTYEWERMESEEKRKCGLGKRMLIILEKTAFY